MSSHEVSVFYRDIQTPLPGPDTWTHICILVLIRTTDFSYMFADYSFPGLLLFPHSCSTALQRWQCLCFLAGWRWCSCISSQPCLQYSDWSKHPLILSPWFLFALSNLHFHGSYSHLYFLLCQCFDLCQSLQCCSSQCLLWLFRASSPALPSVPPKWMSPGVMWDPPRPTLLVIMTILVLTSYLLTSGRVSLTLLTISLLSRDVSSTSSATSSTSVEAGYTFLVSGSIQSMFAFLWCLLCH